MLNLKSVALGAAFLGSAATMTLTADVAQAATIEGTVAGFGISDVTGDITVNFGNAFTFATGDLSDLNGVTTLQTLVLTQVSGSTYSYGAKNPFMTFQPSGKTLGLLAGQATVTFDGPDDVEIDFTPLTGALFGPAPDKEFEVLLSGSLSLSDTGIDDPGSLGTFQYTLQPVSNLDPDVVPEPLTILGAGTAIAFGGAFKRKLNKKGKKESTKA